MSVDRSLPMFPLGGVLFPGMLLPLQVFEPRYHRLVQDCLAADAPEFGVVLIERGSEVGGGDVRSDVGSVARILRVQPIDQGRVVLVAGGVRRIAVERWLDDDPYPRAVVRDWPDTDPSDDLAAVAAEAIRRSRRCLALAGELGERTEPLPDELPDDPGVLSNVLAAVAPLGPADRQRLLRCEGPTARFDLLLGLLDELDEVQRFRLSGG